MTISQGANDVRSRMKQGSPGDLMFMYDLHRGHKTLLNSNGQAKQSDTITVDTAANNTAYTVSVNGVSISITSDASATKQEIADALADALNADPLVRMVVDSVSDGVDTITLTGLLPGESYTLTESDPNLSTASVTSAASASDIEPGRLLVSIADGFTDDGEEEGILASASAFTAQIDTLTPSGYVSGAELFVQVSVSGWFEYIAETTSATSLNDTLNALVGALNDLLPANSVVAANSGGTAITLTAEVAGLEFDVSVGTGTGGASNPSWSTSSNKSRSTSVLLAAAGFSRNRADLYKNASGDPVWQANDPVNCVEVGSMWIEKDSGESITNGGRAYVELNNGAENGRIYTSKTATRIPLPKNKVQYKRDARANSGDLIAGVQIDLTN